CSDIRNPALADQPCQAIDDLGELLGAAEDVLWFLDLEQRLIERLDPLLDFMQDDGQIEASSSCRQEAVENLPELNLYPVKVLINLLVFARVEVESAYEFPKVGDLPQDRFLGPGFCDRLADSLLVNVSLGLGLRQSETDGCAERQERIVLHETFAVGL